MESDGIETIPRSIVELLSDKNVMSLDSKYSASYMARVINRSIPGTNADSYVGTDYSYLRRGHFINQSEMDVYPSFVLTKEQWKAGFGQYSHHGYIVNYPDLILPGLHHGEELLLNLDKAIGRIDVSRLKDDEKYYFAEFVAIIIGAAHAFPDGNGRAAVGVAEIYINRFTGKKFDPAIMYNRNNDLELALNAGSFGMLPVEYNPYVVVENAIEEDDPNREITVLVPSFKPDFSAEDRRLFVHAFAESISGFTGEFKLDYVLNPENASTRYKLSYEAIKKLGLLFKDAAK